ncbi:hypothetical protein COV39_00535 [Candidatus Berkelbacteria bacterium CG11_big_fil_rev_8_21_14_0_20_40_23]|nr:MAG: hypothetical protein COV39_00535 [Candidatus Berkelbacteria bacterium CG11_big_fil_rev_8_21_14_0_20_40_23]PIX30497.1 MAG: hypothetical protein COZ62_02335 [Candidatus Berkelbacteria bacterium CG_4_8_14_3_um_filter_39_27]PIZ28823.1 MAG: hypothetical protein COY44_02140 [Candidatus Berkelbacteria bacterium CG_4_10_14_0_8_um_filter_39_42]
MTKHTAITLPDGNATQNQTNTADEINEFRALHQTEINNTKMRVIILTLIAIIALVFIAFPDFMCQMFQTWLQ